MSKLVNFKCNFWGTKCHCVEDIENKLQIFACMPNWMLPISVVPENEGL